MLLTVITSTRQQERDDERRDEADDERDPPVAVGGDAASGCSLAHRHLPQGAGRVQDAHAGVVDPPDAGERVGLLAHDLDGLDGVAAWRRSAARAARS